MAFADPTACHNLQALSNRRLPPACPSLLWRRLGHPARSRPQTELLRPRGSSRRGRTTRIAEAATRCRTTTGIRSHAAAGAVDRIPAAQHPSRTSPEPSCPQRLHFSWRRTATGTAVSVSSIPPLWVSEVWHRFQDEVLMRVCGGCAGAAHRSSSPGAAVSSVGRSRTPRRCYDAADAFSSRIRAPSTPTSASALHAACRAGLANVITACTGIRVPATASDGRCYMRILVQRLVCPYTLCAHTLNRELLLGCP